MHLIDELTKNYGPVDVIWFDGTDPVPYDKGKYATDAIPPMVYSRNPNTMLGTHGAVKEDFISFEHMVGGFDRVKPWETCEAINPSGWVYNKPMEPFLFEDLLRTMVYTICRDGNYLLDVGPMETGELYPPDVKRLEQFADWRMEKILPIIFLTRIISRCLLKAFFLTALILMANRLWKKQLCVLFLTANLMNYATTFRLLKTTGYG